MQDEEHIRRKYETAVAFREKRKDEVTFDAVDSDAENVIKILGEVLQVKSE